MPDTPLTGPQIKALEHLALHQEASLSKLGYACTAFRWAYVPPDALAAIGGRMGHRLAEAGLANSCSDSEGYAITPAGLRALKQAGIVPIKGPHAGGGTRHG